MSASQRADVEAWAKSDLWEATGRVYGTCEVSVMPCNDWGVLCGTCWNSYRSCGCAFISEVKLPGPVHSIVSVVVDGVELDQADYRVDDWQWLVRLDGGVWPVWTDLADPDSFLVTYLLGQEPPAGAGSVTGMLVCARSGCSNANCKVPRNATQVSRQGTTMTLNNGVGTNSRAWRYYPDTVAVFGIPDVDAWVRNANAPVHAGAVHSPDLPTVRQITWEATSP
jgi:hypothetical protein